MEGHIEEDLLGGFELLAEPQVGILQEAGQ